MSLALARVVRALAALLWATGVAWLVLHYGFRSATEFGETDSPYVSRARIAHGVVALVTVLLLGWVGASHAYPRWRVGQRQLSGGLMVAWCVGVGVSGFALYYLTEDALRSASSLLHQGLGTVGIALALQHMRRQVA